MTEQDWARQFIDDVVNINHKYGMGEVSSDDVDAAVERLKRGRARTTRSDRPKRGRAADAAVDRLKP